ncbi:MAG: class I SAM-dependent rRNA methyltransferase [Planctomycetota bacterium]|nr:class I SAM-dependent rRNA methyltransferase [Planctomycetota bacterium]
MTEPVVKVRKGFVRPLYGGHPWVFADAVASIEGSPEAGDVVRVLDPTGSFLGKGFYNPKSAMAVRILTRRDESVDAGFFRAKIESAAAFRERVLGLKAGDGDTTAFRLVNSEGDGLGGLIADRYGDTLAVQFQSAGFEKRRGEILGILMDLFRPARIFDCSENSAREKEGLPPAPRGVVAGEGPEGPVSVLEAGAKFEVDLSGGQKTGLFLDQRENRLRVRALAAGRRVLDLYCYTAGFGIHAGLGGAASVTLVEKSPAAAERGYRNLVANGLEAADMIRGDALEVMKGFAGEGRRFDLIVLDPPKLARSKEGVSKALEHYREINFRALRMLADGTGAILVTCSCSGNVSEQEFERAVGAAAVAAGREMAVVERRGPAADHPGIPGFDQGRYLKCLILVSMR